MVGLRSPSIGFGLAFLALACFFGSALAAPQVYLSLTGSTAWDGACPTSGSSCSAGAPCSLPSHGITLDGSVTKCEISFGAGAYGTESEKQKVSIIQAASGSTNLTVSFDGSNGGVVGLDITLSANEVGYNGLISQSNLNVILGPVQTVRMYALKSNTTRAFFTGTQPLAYSPSITVLRSEMMFDKLMVADLFVRSSQGGLFAGGGPTKIFGPPLLPRPTRNEFLTPPNDIASRFTCPLFFHCALPIAC